MPTVNVVVNKSYNIHVLLDSGSTNSFITADAVNYLPLTDKTISYQLSTITVRSISMTVSAISQLQLRTNQQQNDIHRS